PTTLFRSRSSLTILSRTLSSSPSLWSRLSLPHPSVAARLSPRPIRQSYVPPPILSWTRRRVEPASTASTTATQSRLAASSAPDPASSTATPPPGRPAPRQSTGEYSPEARHMRPLDSPPPNVPSSTCPSNLSASRPLGSSTS